MEGPSICSRTCIRKANKARKSKRPPAASQEGVLICVYTSSLVIFRSHFRLR